MKNTKIIKASIVLCIFNFIILLYYFLGRFNGWSSFWKEINWFTIAGEYSLFSIIITIVFLDLIRRLPINKNSKIYKTHLYLNITYIIGYFLNVTFVGGFLVVTIFEPFLR
ncbi:hypothetical protein [Anaerovorax odorimutans]|uniref:hypothetical protein n=1 Tax=Anaerovorax odorimutans TaxID=109327 RepID=UPI000484E811|nr:hypothetical protein [Anaerovorax odorimutans]